MKLATDKFGVYIVHMEEMSEEKSFPPAVRKNLNGYLNSWNKTFLHVKLCFFADLLEPFSKLPMAFQEDEIDHAKAIKLTKHEGKPVDRYHSVKLLKRKIESNNNGRDFYNKFEIKNFDQEIESLTKVVDTFNIFS